MNLNYKACMFDLDGTLANTLASIAHFGNGALEAFGYPAIPPEEYKQLVGNGADLLVRRMLTRSAGDYTEEIFRSVRKTYDHLYESDPLKLVSPYDGIREMLETLHKNGVKLAILSNKPDDMTNCVARGLFDPAFFAVIQGQKEGVPKKPDPTAPSMLLAEMGVSPQECLYIGDSGVDMETGRNAGMTTAGVTWGFRSRQELLEHGASCLVEHPAEITAMVLGNPTAGKAQ